jgi:type IV secretory pathway TraG/TraD family ATPase VirD4
VKADPQKEKSTADPYWDQAAVSLLSAEIAYTKMTDKDATFADVLELHDMLSIEDGYGTVSTSLDALFDDVDEKCFAVSCWKSFKSLPIRTAGCVFGTLNTTIDTIFTPELREMIANKPSIDFEEFAKNKTALFVTTSAVNPSLHFYVNMFYAQAFKQLFEYAEGCPDGVLPIPVHMLCDDFACGGRVLNFPEYISIFREKGISVTLLLQSESQLEQMYGEDNATTIINNCDTYIFLGGMDLLTARNISVRLNCPLDEVLYMPIGDEIIFRRGHRPIQTTRYDVRRDKQYQDVSRGRIS